MGTMRQILVLINLAICCIVIGVIPSTNAGCSYKVEVKCSTCNKGSHVANPEIYGYYYAKSSGTVNGKVHWESGDGNYAIWYGTYGRWNVGTIGDLGANKSWAYVSSTADCPNSPGW